MTIHCCSIVALAFATEKFSGNSGELKKKCLSSSFRAGENVRNCTTEFEYKKGLYSPFFLNKCIQEGYIKHNAKVYITFFINLYRSFEIIE